MMEPLRVSLLQTDMVWENIPENLARLHRQLKPLAGTTDLAVLPEMFNTGFTMESERLAETTVGPTLTALREWVATYGMALAGSFIATEQGKYYNRAFLLTPEGESYFYDKRHLFRMGNEPLHFSAGSERVICSYRGWNICLLICYDLRFPVWSRNRGNAYDLLIYVANWPDARRRVWDTLLEARALENMCYVCGVNRVGTDGNGLRYDGGSVICSPRGERLTAVPDCAEGTATATLDGESLLRLRKRFPVWKDADEFRME